MKPVIALVGRPNVGKSTLFNRLTKTRDAIVADLSGLTRDRHYGNARLGDRAFIVVDTGGFEPENPIGIVREMARQTRQAVAEADVVVFVVDVRAGVCAHDHDIARFLRIAGKKVVLTVNKAEGMAESPAVAEFYELGLGEPQVISSAHGQGIGQLLERALDAAAADAAAEEGDEPERDDASPTRLAVAGRPNVGKSTLINAWLGEER
ncbi:MAG: GTPase, partial [Caldimonas sp.]